MDPSDLRNKLLWRDICCQCGRPELADETVRAFRILREAYGEYFTVKERHRDEVYTYVLRADEEAQQLFAELEPRRLATAPGLHDVLSTLRSWGLVLDIVSELVTTVGPIAENIILRFLEAHDLRQYFRYLVTPLGKIDVRSGQVIDERYHGYTKSAGTIYDLLKEDLLKEGIDPSCAVMVGDRPSADIEPAHARGLRTVQYAGYSDYPPSPAADAVITDMRELLELIAGWRQAE